MSRVLPEILLVRADGTEHFKYANENDKKIYGNRNKIGGTPNWLQNEERINCPSCGDEMIFYAQIDSVNDEISIGDGGMVYVFVCLDCLETESIIQSF